MKEEHRAGSISIGCFRKVQRKGEGLAWRSRPALWTGQAGRGILKPVLCYYGALNAVIKSSHSQGPAPMFRLHNLVQTAMCGKTPGTLSICICAYSHVANSEAHWAFAGIVLQDGPVLSLLADEVPHVGPALRVPACQNPAQRVYAEPQPPLGAAGHSELLQAAMATNAARMNVHGFTVHMMWV